MKYTDSIAGNQNITSRDFNMTVSLCGLWQILKRSSMFVSEMRFSRDAASGRWSPRPRNVLNENRGVLKPSLFKVALIHQVNAPWREFLRGSPEVQRCSLAFKKHKLGWKQQRDFWSCCSWTVHLTAGEQNQTGRHKREAFIFLPETNLVQLQSIGELGLKTSGAQVNKNMRTTLTQRALSAMLKEIPVFT